MTSSAGVADGWAGLVRRTLHRGAHDATRAWHDVVGPALRSERTFVLDGVSHRYASDRHHPTWRSERTVELAVARAVIPGHRRILEVGNVLTGYGTTGHLVVDKYDRTPGVVNDDIVDHHGGPFDLIVSISTVEHVGWDERPRDPGKAGRALDHMLALLDRDGEMLVTIPVGYHRDLDDDIAAGRWVCAVGYLHRTGGRVWQQCAPPLALSTTYGWPRPGANALAVLWWSSPSTGAPRAVVERR